MKRAVLFLAFVAFSALAQAQSYPSKPVKLIIPYPAGGVVDVVARIATERIAASWGQPIVVENKPGANGNIGAEQVKNAPADGYTLLLGSTFLTVNPLLDKHSKVGHKDFSAIGTVAMPPNLLVVPANSSAKNLKELVTLARSQPGLLNAPNPGIGSSNHLGTEVLQALAGIDLNLVGYKGQPPFIPDLINGQLHFSFISAGLAISHIKDGKLRPLAVSSNERLKSLPEVPTVIEAGYKDAVVLPWAGLFAPAGTPAAVLDKVAAELKKALQDPEAQKRYDGLNASNPALYREAFDRFVGEEAVRWTRVVAERKIKQE